jgi:hypothetical protein
MRRLAVALFLLNATFSLVTAMTAGSVIKQAGAIGAVALMLAAAPAPRPAYAEHGANFAMALGVIGGLLGGAVFAPPARYYYRRRAHYHHYYRRRHHERSMAEERLRRADQQRAVAPISRVSTAGAPVEQAAAGEHNASAPRLAIIFP